MKIGQLVRTYIANIFRNCDDDELLRLTNKDYSKSTFDINFPFCADSSNIQNERYWKDIHIVRAKTVRVCNDWYDRSREAFLDYLISKGIADADSLPSPGDHPLPIERQPSLRPRSARQSWPEWKSPSDEDLLKLAKLTTPYIHFLHPDIVRLVVEDNERRREKWSDQLNNRGINPDLYLWRNSPCAFPGVRRYAGSTEIARYRGRMEATRPNNALTLDDNDYPKHIWSFVFRGKPFQKQGPVGYSLAHLTDHKDYKNRHGEEIKSSEANFSAVTYFGLYTCVTNTVYMPNGLIRPTDFSFPIRNLIQRKAAEIYGDFCELLAPHLSFRVGESESWPLDAFDWHEPVGTMQHIQAFLTYRNEKMKALFDAAPDTDEVGTYAAPSP